MAERRMISKKIVCTDKFLSLSDKSKIAYFYLLMEADDDGFIGNVRAVMSMCGIGLKSLTPLIENDYLLWFNSGVAAIAHWRAQNRVPKDRYTPTIYIDECSKLALDDNMKYEYLSSCAR